METNIGNFRCQSPLELLTRPTDQMYKTYRTVGKTALRPSMPEAVARLRDRQG